MSWVGPSASLISTVSDLNRFYGMLLAGKIVRPSSPAQMQRALSQSSPKRERRHYPEHRKSPTCPLLVPVRPARAAEAARSHHATAVPSSSTIRVGIASRVTPSIVVVGATLAAPNRDASTP